MARGRPGTFGFKAAGELRPTKKLRQYYKRKAMRQARREFRPQRRALRRQLQRQRRAMRRDMASAQAAADVFSEFAQQGARRLPGMKQRDVREVNREYALRAADVQQSVPFLQSDIRAQHLPGIQETRNMLMQSRMDQLAAAQEMFSSLVAGGMEQAQSAQARRGRGHEALRTGLLLAQRIHDKYQKLLDTPNGKLTPADRTQKQMLKEVLENDPDFYWALISDEVSKNEGVNPLQAERAVRLFRRNVERDDLASLGRGLARAVVPGPVGNLAATGVGALLSMLGMPAGGAPTADEIYRLWLLSRRGR